MRGVHPDESHKRAYRQPNAGKSILPSTRSHHEFDLIPCMPKFLVSFQLLLRTSLRSFGAVEQFFLLHVRAEERG